MKWERGWRGIGLVFQREGPTPQWRAAWLHGLCLIQRGRKCLNLTLNQKLDVQWRWGRSCLLDIWKQAGLKEKHRILQKVLDDDVLLKKRARWNFNLGMRKSWTEVVDNHLITARDGGSFAPGSGPSGAVWAGGGSLWRWSAWQRGGKEHPHRSLHERPRVVWVWQAEGQSSVLACVRRSSAQQ